MPTTERQRAEKGSLDPRGRGWKDHSETQQGAIVFSDPFARYLETLGLQIRSVSSVEQGTEFVVVLPSASKTIEEAESAE